MIVKNMVKYVGVGLEPAEHGPNVLTSLKIVIIIQN